MVEIVFLLQCSGIYWFDSDCFPKAISTLAVQGQALSAEVSGNYTGYQPHCSLELELCWQRLARFDSRQCSLIMLERKRYSF